MSLLIRTITCIIFPVFVMSACTVYDVDKVDNKTLAGSLNRAVNKDRGRYQPSETNDDNTAPIYVDYSKSNPLLRHDDEFDKSKKYSSEDPFEEQVDFSDYQQMKKKQQAKRNMEQEHQVEEKEAGISLW